MVHRVSSRSMFAGSLSLTVHGAILLLVVVVFGLHATRAPVVDLVPIEIIAPEPPVAAAIPGPSGPGTRAGGGNAPKAGAIGRRGSDAPKRSVTKAPPVRDPYADVVIGYDAPDSANTGTEQGTLIGIGAGAGLEGTGPGEGAGFGAFGDGPGIPAPPVSHARPPRPKRDYEHQQLTKTRKYAGLRVSVALAIDPAGHVRKVSLIQGVEPRIDRQAIDIARSFEFYPALRDDGEPRWGSFRWDFVIEQARADLLDPDTEGEGSMLWRQRVRGDNVAPVTQ